MPSAQACITSPIVVAGGPDCVGPDGGGGDEGAENVGDEDECMVRERFASEMYRARCGLDESEEASVGRVSIRYMRMKPKMRETPT